MTFTSTAIVVCCLSALATGAWGQAPSPVFVDDLTWPELKRDIAAGKTTILVPIGGTEQNGPHMALGKHNARARVLAEKIARELGNALVAPVVSYVPEGSIDPPSAHMRFPGTITIPDKTFQQILESAARSFKLHGFRDIVFLGDHGGYQKDEQVVADRLNREWAATSVRVARPRRVLPRDHHRLRRRPQGPRLFGGRDRHPRRPRRYVADDGAGAGHGSRRCPCAGRQANRRRRRSRRSAPLQCAGGTIGRGRRHYRHRGRHPQSHCPPLMRIEPVRPSMLQFVNLTSG